jgi:hypothetical protein
MATEKEFPASLLAIIVSISFNVVFFFFSGLLWGSKLLGILWGPGLRLAEAMPKHYGNLGQGLADLVLWIALGNIFFYTVVFYILIRIGRILTCEEQEDNEL